MKQQICSCGCWDKDILYWYNKHSHHCWHATLNLLTSHYSTDFTFVLENGSHRPKWPKVSLPAWIPETRWEYSAKQNSEHCDGKVWHSERWILWTVGLPNPRGEWGWERKCVFWQVLFWPKWWVFLFVYLNHACMRTLTNSGLGYTDQRPTLRRLKKSLSSG